MLQQMKIVMIVANFFVQYHDIDGDAHVYEFKAVKHESINDNGIEHFISYRGYALPVDDKKKFYAEMKLECYDFVNLEHERNVTRRICTALRIVFNPDRR